MKILAAAFALCFLAGAGGAALQLNRTEATADASAPALFLPATYEQYLPLANPSDVAINDDYIAIADGSLIYVYARGEGGSYRVYTHQAGSSIPITISKLQFSDEGKLYFADSAQQLYELALDTLTPSAPLLALSTFYIAQRTLYAVTVAPTAGTTIYKLSMDRPLEIASAECSQPLSNSPTTPSMTYASGTLYCALTGTAFAYNGETLTSIGSFRLDNSLAYLLETASVCAVGDAIYYTDTRGLLRTDSEGNSKILYEGADFRALTASGDSLYCVKGSSVRALALDSGKYTGYEIAAASDSENRLSGATETVRARDLIVTADGGNKRISVYNTRTEEFSVLPCEGTPACVATDGDVIAAGVGNSVLLYHYGNESPYYVHNSESAITGVAVVYGECYFITSHTYGVAKADEREFPRADSPLSITSDLYGNLYVADLQGAVTKYTEAEFVDYSASGTVMTDGWSFPATGKSLRADFGGGIYYLYNNAIWKNGARFADALGADLVYTGSRTPALSSFALAFEDREVYLQYGDFVVSVALDFPTLDTIDASGRYEEIFRTPSERDLQLVTVAERSAGIGVDLAALEQGSGYFTPMDYARTENGGMGILLAGTETFSLVALYENYGYTVALYRNEDCAIAEKHYRPAEPAARYITSEVAFSYYPCLTPALTIKRLPRATEVTLLTTFEKDVTGFDYAYVEADGVYGYVPLSYLSENMPGADTPEEYFLGYLKASEDGVVLYAEDGERITVTVRTQVRIVDLKNGRYRVTLLDGEGKYGAANKAYSAEVTRDRLESGNPNALRVSLIVILCVIAVGIVAAYAFFVQRKKKD